MVSKDLEFITWLRFPLMVAVVCIHSQVNQYQILDPTISYSIVGGIQYLFSVILASVAVPLFFMFSGYLFFFNIETFEIKTYWNKIKRRVKTLLIPYIIWNILFIFYVFCLQWVTHKTSTPEVTIVADYSVNDWVRACWSLDTNHPINYPLWFIRDLFIVSLCSPIIYWLIKLEKKIFPQYTILLLVLGLLYILDIPSEKRFIPSIPSVFCFTLGAYFSLSHKSFIPPKKIGISITFVYGFLIVILMILYNQPHVHIIHRVAIIVGLFCVIYLTSLIKNKHIYPILTNATFFIYVTHAFVIRIFDKLTNDILSPIITQNQFIALAAYIVVISATILLGIVGNYLLQQYMPKTANILLGGR